jgi:hypothetical protein
MHYQEYFDRPDEGCCPLPDMENGLVFLIVQVGHNQTDSTITGQTIKVFNGLYGNTMKRDRFFHILKFLILVPRIYLIKHENYDTMVGSPSNSTHQRNTHGLG